MLLEPLEDMIEPVRGLDTIDLEPLFPEAKLLMADLSPQKLLSTQADLRAIVCSEFSGLAWICVKLF